jgi:hypothetical protein
MVDITCRHGGHYNPCGGYDDDWNVSAKSEEVFGIPSQTWRIIPIEMKRARSYFGLFGPYDDGSASHTVHR